MKKNKLLACLAAALCVIALMGITACDNNKDDEDDVSSGLEGKTLVADDFTYVNPHGSYDSANNKYTSVTYKISKALYMKGESDDLVTVYFASESGGSYDASYYKYSIDDDSITFTQWVYDSDSKKDVEKSWTGTIDGDSFTIGADFVSSRISSGDLTFRVGSAPDSATWTAQ